MNSVEELNLAGLAVCQTCVLCIITGVKGHGATFVDGQSSTLASSDGEGITKRRRRLTRKRDANDIAFVLIVVAEVFNQVVVTIYGKTVIPGLELSLRIDREKNCAEANGQ